MLLADAEMRGSLPFHNLREFEQISEQSVQHGPL